MNKLFGMLGKAVPGSAKNFMKPIFKGGAAEAFNVTNQMKMQLGFAALTYFTSGGSPAEKSHAMMNQLGSFMMVAGMRGSLRQQFWQSAILMAPNLPDMGRGIVQGYRGVLEARTMAAVPFSYSTLAMDQALSAMQYGQSRLQDSHSVFGSEAAFMSARYMQRG